MNINNVILVPCTCIILLSSFMIYFFCIYHLGNFPTIHGGEVKRVQDGYTGIYRVAHFSLCTTKIEGFLLGDIRTRSSVGNHMYRYRYNCTLRPRYNFKFIVTGAWMAE